MCINIAIVFNNLHVLLISCWYVYSRITYITKNMVPFFISKLNWRGCHYARYSPPLWESVWGGGVWGFNLSPYTIGYNGQCYRPGVQYILAWRNAMIKNHGLFLPLYVWRYIMPPSDNFTATKTAPPPVFATES